MPSGPDDRCIISSERIKQILGITDSVWIFIDIKSAGPRDDFNHAVMSRYQISGSENWQEEGDGVLNSPITAMGKRASHEFLCALSLIYVLSDGTVAPLVTFVIKPVYSMSFDMNGHNTGQPLNQIKIASIPNGLLLTRNPNYNKLYRDCFIPAKMTKKRTPVKSEHVYHLIF